MNQNVQPGLEAIVMLYLDDCVGVFAAEVFLPSNVAKCPSRASSNELGALVRSGISPLSMPTFCKHKHLSL